MEGAIKTVVMQYLSSARGKESLGGKNFQKLVQSQLGNILSVRSRVPDVWPDVFNKSLILLHLVDT